MKESKFIKKKWHDAASAGEENQDIHSWKGGENDESQRKWMAEHSEFPLVTSLTYFYYFEQWL